MYVYYMCIWYMRIIQTYILYIYVYVYGAALGLLGGQKIRKPKKF